MTRNEVTAARMRHIVTLIESGACDVIALSEDESGFAIKVAFPVPPAAKACGAGTPGCTGALKQLTGGRQGCGRCGQEVGRD